MSYSRKIPGAEKFLLSVGVLALLSTDLTARIYRLRDEEPNWNIPSAPPIPHPNGYDSYLAAAQTSVPFTPPVDAELAGGEVDPHSAYARQNFSLARRQQWLRANVVSFSWIDKGLKTPSLAPQNNGFASSNWGTFLNVADQMVARTDTLQLEHQPMRATMSALDTMQMGQDVTRAGNYGARLAGVVIFRIGRGPLDDRNKTIDALNTNEALSCTHRLEALLNREQTTIQMFMVEKREQLLQLRRIFGNPDWRERLLAEETTDGTRESPLQKWKSQMVSKRDIYNSVNTTLQDEIAWAQQPYSRAKVAFPSPDLYTFTKLIVIGPSSVKHYVEWKAIHDNANTMLLLRLSLRAYIARHGEAPPRLSSLVPTYLNRVPTDVYNDGKPLFYISHGKTYRLWSVGPDGVNNGGISLERTFLDKPGLPTRADPDSTGDFVAGECR